MAGNAALLSRVAVPRAQRNEQTAVASNCGRERRVAAPWVGSLAARAQHAGTRRRRGALPSVVANRAQPRMKNLATCHGTPLPTLVARPRGHPAASAVAHALGRHALGTEPRSAPASMLPLQDCPCRARYTSWLGGASATSRWPRRTAKQQPCRALARIAFVF